MSNQITEGLEHRGGVRQPPDNPINRPSPPKGQGGTERIISPDEYEVRVKRMTLEPDNVSATVGSVEVSMSRAGFGSVKVDGVPMKCRRVTIEIEAGVLPVVVLEVVP